MLIVALEIVTNPEGLAVISTAAVGSSEGSTVEGAAALNAPPVWPIAVGSTPVIDGVRTAETSPK